MIEVLLVSDNDDFCDSIKIFCKEKNKFNLSYIVKSFDDLKNNMYRKHDFIFVDMYIPNNGFKVLNYLKNINNKTKIIVFSHLLTNDMRKLISSYNVSFYFEGKYDYETLNYILDDLYSFDNVVDDIEYKVMRILNKLGMSNKLVGFEYVKSCVLFVYYNYEVRVLKDVMKNVSNKNIECKMRRAINISWDKADPDLVDYLFSSTIDIDGNCPTVSEYIYLIADKLRVGRFDI